MLGENKKKKKKENTYYTIKEMFLFNWWCRTGYFVSEQVVWFPGKEIEEANTCLTWWAMMKRYCEETLS